MCSFYMIRYDTIYYSPTAVRLVLSNIYENTFMREHILMGVAARQV